MGTERACTVSGISGVGFFTSKKAWKKINLQKKDKASQESHRVTERPLVRSKDELPSHFHDKTLLFLNLMVFHDEREAWNDPFTKPGNAAVTPTARNKSE